MNLTPTELPEVVIIEPRVFGDSRGVFLETFHAKRYAAAGIRGPFVQDNLSTSVKGTIRGLHFPGTATAGEARVRDPGHGLRRGRGH